MCLFYERTAINYDMLVIVLIMGGKMLSRSKAALFHRGSRIASPEAGQMVLSSAIFSALIVIPAYAATRVFLRMIWQDVAFK